MCYAHDARNIIPAAGIGMGTWITMSVDERRRICKIKNWVCDEGDKFLERESKRHDEFGKGPKYWERRFHTIFGELYDQIHKTPKRCRSFI